MQANGAYCLAHRPWITYIAIRTATPPTRCIQRPQLPSTYHAGGGGQAPVSTARRAATAMLPPQHSTTTRLPTMPGSAAKVGASRRKAAIAHPAAPAEGAGTMHTEGVGDACGWSTRRTRVSAPHGTQAVLQKHLSNEHQATPTFVRCRLATQPQVAQAAHTPAHARARQPSSCDYVIM